MKKRFLWHTIGILFLFCQTLVSQNTKWVTIHFAPVFENQALELGKKYESAYQKNNVSFTVFKCYVSHFEFYKNQQLIYSDEISAFLLDTANPDSFNRKMILPEKINFDEIRFYFGIDDKTNDKGISGGDLDPTKGMYWTWQTGYINMKLEGYCQNSPAADHSFQFHLGGFIAPFASFQAIQLKTAPTNNITIYIEINNFLKKISLIDTPTVMSPGEKALALSKIAASMFHL